MSGISRACLSLMACAFASNWRATGRGVLALLERIRHDPRHINVEILHHGPLVERRFKRFSLGYTSAENDDALCQLEQLNGQPAVDAFVALLSTLAWDS